jgi:hypothetical protein
MGGALISQLLNRFRETFGADFGLGVILFRVTQAAVVRSLAVCAARDDTRRDVEFRRTPNE